MLLVIFCILSLNYLLLSFLFTYSSYVARLCFAWYYYNYYCCCYMLKNMLRKKQIQTNHSSALGDYWFEHDIYQGGSSRYRILNAIDLKLLLGLTPSCYTFLF